MASDLGYPLIRASGQSRQRNDYTEEELARAKQRATEIAKGSLLSPFTWAPDLMGMIGRASMNIPSISAGGRAPELSGDPIREAAGLDPGSVWGMAGEFLDPTATAAKTPKLVGVLANMLGKAPEMVAAAGTLPPLVKGVDKATDAIQTVDKTLPKITAKRFVDQGHGARAQQRFLQRLSEARQKMDPSDAAQVDPVLPDGFKGKVYQTEDGLAGFALSDDGYLSNLYKDPEAPFRGTLGASMTKARAAGAKNLEAFDTYLVRNYLAEGATETGRGPFNPEMATPDIIRGLGARSPDWVQMDIGGVIPTQKHSELLGPRAQEELLRFHAARGEPKPVTDAFRGGKVSRLNRLVDKGIEQGGEKWYWMGGLLDQYIAQFGPELGVKRFDRFMELNAAVSPRSTVSKEIQRASILYQREIEGKTINNILQPKGTSKNQKGLEPAWPQGTGHLANDIHMQNIERLLREGGFSSVDQPKIASYVENLKGNYRPMTIDTHNAYVTMGRKNAKGEAVGPTDAQYPYLESRQAELGARKGLDPAEWQSALWVGAGDITGVDDVRNFPDAMNQRIAKTAEVLDIPEQEALVRFMSGDTRLYSVMAALIGAGVLKEAADAESGQQL